MDEAISSAILSGAMIQNPNAKKMLREKREPRKDSEIQVCNAYALLNLSRDFSARDFGEDMLLELNDKASGGKGEYRTSGEPHVSEYSRDPNMSPFPAASARRVMPRLRDFASDESVHPLIRAFALEYMLMRIQPFRSDNCTTARAAASWLMSKTGYDADRYISVSSVLRARSAQYRRTFLTSEAEDDDMTYAIEFCLSAMCTAIDTFLEDAERKARESADLLEGISAEDLNSRQRAVLADLARSEEGLTIAEVATKHQVSYQTARGDLILLDQRGLARKGSREGHRDTYKYVAKTL